MYFEATTTDLSSSQKTFQVVCIYFQRCRTVGNNCGIVPELEVTRCPIIVKCRKFLVAFRTSLYCFRILRCIKASKVKH